MAKSKQKNGASGVLRLDAKEGEDPMVTLARVVQAPGFRHAHLVGAFGTRSFGETIEKPDLSHDTEVMAETLEAAARGDKAFASKMLAAQAATLDAIFTEMARVSLLNMGQYPDAADRYMRLGLKAQTASRSTLEALTKLHQPREQIVKHINVNDGGQAVIADELHQHRDRGQNEEPDGQAHAQGARCATMLGKDPEGDGVPISSGSRQEALSDARRSQGKRSAAG